MTIKEARKFVAVLMVTYPNYNPIDEELAAETWAGVTEEYTYEQVDIALRSYMKTNTIGFAPTPGQIIDKIHTMTQPQELNEMEAWSLASKAIRNSGYNSTEEFAKLPPLVQKAVGLPSQLRTWALDENYNEEVVSSNFIKCYRNELTKQRELQKMPQSVRNLIEKANVGSHSAQIAEKRQQAIESANERNQSEIKALETKHDSVPMPEKYKERLEDMRNDDERKY